MVCREMAFLPPPSSAADHQFFFQNHLNVDNPADHDPSSLNVLPSCPPQDLIHGHPHHLSSLSMMNHHHHQHPMSLSPAVSYNNFTNDDHHQQHQQTAPNNNNGVGDDELSEEEGSHLMMSLGEKKKRLSLEQVKTLEKSFELGNKLEPERKMQLAKALGLQPRQVAIWFQNRRARWKTKQLEKDYNLLKRQFDSLKADNDSLQTQNKKLHAELLSLKNGKDPTEFRAINLNAETKSYCWSNNGCEISSDINLGMSTATPRGSTPPPPPPQQEDHHIVHHHHHHDHSPPSNNNINKHQLDQFTSSFLPTSLTDLLTKSSSHDQAAGGLQDDGFCSLFGGGGGGGSSGGGGSAGVGVQEQPPPFWAWPPDQHHLH